MEVHIWGNGEGVADFHAESLAITWFVNIYYPDQGIRIIPDSDIYSTAWGSLPYLKDTQGELVQGFKEIITFLGSELGSPLQNKFPSLEYSLIHDGLLETVLSKVNVITQFTLFVNHENYVGYSRGLFKTLLPFPLQYTPPLNLRAKATEFCEMYGLSVEAGSRSIEEDDKLKELIAKEHKLKEIPVLSSAHENQIDKSLNEIMLQKNILSNMQCIHFAEIIYKDIVKLRKSLLNPRTGRTKYFFGDFISPSEILLYANIFVQQNEKLPSLFMNTYISENYPDFIKRSLSLHEEHSAVEKSPVIGLPHALASSIYHSIV